MRKTYRRRAAAVVAAVSALLVVIPEARALDAVTDTAASAPGEEETPQAEREVRPDAVPLDERGRVLGEGWRDSEDRLVTTSGDGAGFHVLVAQESEGYAWRTAASLSEPGFDADAWIGNACVTASGERAVVVYAPRTFTNEPELMTRGAFTAVVDLDSGEVTKLPVLSSLAYFSPGCGTGESAVVSQFSDDNAERNATRLVEIDAAAAEAGRALEVPGQVTSAVPHEDGIVAASGANLVRIDGEGEQTRLVRTRGVPFQITADAQGGVVFLEPDGSQEATVSRLRPDRVERPRPEARPDRLASGELTAFDLTRSADGTAIVTGEARTTGSLPSVVANPGGLAKDARASTRGDAVVHSRWADGRDSRISPEEAVSARVVRAEVTALDTEEETVLDTAPAAVPLDAQRMAEGAELSPALPTAGGEVEGARMGAAAASPTDPVEAERTCSVPRGDVNQQAFQPTPRQVEWAVNQAVVNRLNSHVSRAADWKGMGMAAYRPQSLFPLTVLHGDPTGAYETDAVDEWHIPAQILLGITAQESNMWQATRFAVPGVTANPLIGNYYGIEYAADGEQTDPWAIDWAEADCGYGITQVTDGMRMAGREKPGETALSPLQQQAVALDYTANIAAGADILAEKWNQTRRAGLTVNNGDPRWIENWFFALWAYNSGFYPESGASENGGYWGVGWTNNPANPLWKANRTPFLENADGDPDYSHAAHPQDWPYPEKVIGWAAYPLSAMTKPATFAAGYREAWWNSNLLRTAVKPSIDLFCDTTNQCNPQLIGEDDQNAPGLGACGAWQTGYELHCWWHKPVEWKNCDNAECGYAVHRFNETYPEQPDETSSYPPRCNDGLPDGTLIVDDVPDGVYPAGAAGHSCGAIESAGDFSFEFTPTATGTYPGKMDLHQIGAGYGNHFWFTHTREEDERLYMRGTWTLNQQINGWARVLVHIPDHGAHTRQAQYEVGGTDSTSPVRAVPQRTRENRWVSLGAFNFTGTPSVTLDNYTADGDGSEDIAWDAVAFQKLPGKPRHQVVAMGDSYSSGEGVSNGNEHYYPETNYRNTLDDDSRNGCHRSTQAWSRQAQAPGYSSSFGEMDDALHPAMDYHFTACSGARTYNMHRYAQEHGELPQLQQGYLDQHTTLVNLSIGGNDARFSHVVQECLLNYLPVSCEGEEFHDEDERIDTEPGQHRDGPYQGLPFAEALPGLIEDVVGDDITRVLIRIHEQAPNARIVLMGYPQLFSDSGRCLSDPLWEGIGLTERSAEWLNGLADLLALEMWNAVQNARTAGVDAYFSDPIAEFAGRTVCGDPETVHGIVTDLTDSDTPAHDWPILPDRGLSAQSFHPKLEGARLYADAFERTLSGMNL